jgi:hypothetical protein
MKTNTTETTALNTRLRGEEPAHEEIAFTAFLAWENEGRQPGRELHYWLQAEAQLRNARTKKAEAAAQVASEWPRPSRTTQVKKPSASATQNLTTEVKRSTAPKSSSRASGRK